MNQVVIRALENRAEIGVSLNEPINLEVKETPLRAALQRLLEPLAMDYHVRDGVLMVTTATDRNLVPRVYEVSELLNADRSSRDLAEVLRQAASQAPERPLPDAAQPPVSVAPFGSFLLVHTSLRGHDEIDRVLDLLEIGLKAQR